jgi:hypothetical protein
VAEQRQPDIRVVGAKLHIDGEVTEVVAVAPPEAAALAEAPEEFRQVGNLALRQVPEGTSSRVAGDAAYDIMMGTANSWGSSSVVSSNSLPGVVDTRRLEAEAYRDLSGNSQ